jgi:putative transposase
MKVRPIDLWEASPTPITVTTPHGPTTRGNSAKLRLGRVSEDFACYALTKVVEFRRPVLATPPTAKILFDSWAFLRRQDRIKVFAFCVMPDHFHLVFCLMPGEDLSKVLEDSSKFTAGQINKHLGQCGRFWQNGFHDHRCRDEDDLHDRCLYVEHNPVRKELVTMANEWPFSSAHPANQWLLDREWWP